MRQGDRDVDYVSSTPECPLLLVLSSYDTLYPCLLVLSNFLSSVLIFIRPVNYNCFFVFFTLFIEAS